MESLARGSGPTLPRRAATSLRAVCVRGAEFEYWGELAWAVLPPPLYMKKERQASTQENWRVFA